MKDISTLGLLLCLLLLPTAFAADHHEAAPTLDEIIAGHIEAKGGREAWEAIASLKITGEFTAFSKIARSR